MAGRLFDHTFHFSLSSFYQLTDPALFIFMDFRRVYSIKDQDFIFCLPIHFYFSIARIFIFVIHFQKIDHILTKDQKSLKTPHKNQPPTPT